MSTTTTLFDTLLEPTFVINQDQEILYMNESAALITSMSARKVVRSKLKLTEVLQFSEFPESLYQLAILSEPSAYKETRFKNINGDEGKVQITVQPYGATDGKAFLVFARDVTLEERLQKKYRAELEQKETYIEDLKAARFELEKYSKNLEQLVEERTGQVKELNRMMKMLLDSLSQGFFMFAPNGHCLDISSKACQTILEIDPVGKEVWDVLRLPNSKIEGFKKWLVTCFSEMLPFEDLAPLGPNEVLGLSKNISLEYFPLRNGEIIEAIVVVATDITNLVLAKKQAESDREKVKMILNLIQNKNEIRRFTEESDSQIQFLASAAKKQKLTQDDQETILRILHTIKGGAACFAISDLVEIAHKAENTLLESKEYSADFLLELANLLSLSFERFKNDASDVLGKRHFTSEKFVEVPIQKIDFVLQDLESNGLGSTATELREILFQEPIENMLAPYQELVKNLAIQLDKEIVPIHFDTAELTWTAEKFQSLSASLVHAFRNTMDHGIENRDERLANGKSAHGNIQVVARKDSEYLVLKILDDGKGIDPKRIRAKLDKQGYDHKNESDDEVIQHVFDSQFSTKEQVSELSGRGVGMDAIAYEVKKLGGLVHVSSTIGLGTCLEIKIPIDIKTNNNRQAGTRVA